MGFRAQGLRLLQCDDADPTMGKARGVPGRPQERLSQPNGRTPRILRGQGLGVRALGGEGGRAPASAAHSYMDIHLF